MKMSLVRLEWQIFFGNFFSNILILWKYEETIMYGFQFIVFLVTFLFFYNLKLFFHYFSSLVNSASLI